MITVGETKVGLTTCYDVTVSRPLHHTRRAGREVICVAASWGAGVGKIEQWQLLTRARALDSTAYVIAAGQADPAAAGVVLDGTAPTGVGYSVAVSPRGEVFESLGAEPGLLVADLDLDVVTRPGQLFPCWPTAGSDSRTA